MDENELATDQEPEKQLLFALGRKENLYLS